MDEVSPQAPARMDERGLVELDDSVPKTSRMWLKCRWTSGYGEFSRRIFPAVALRSVHGAGWTEFDSHRDRAGFHQVRRDVSLERTERNLRQRGTAADAVDRTAAGRRRTGDRDRHVPNRQQDGD